MKLRSKKKSKRRIIKQQQLYYKTKQYDTTQNTDKTTLYPGDWRKFESQLPSEEI